MTHREKILRLFKLRRQDNEYVTYAQSLVFEGSSEARPEELERCGQRFLELMVNVYARKFNEAQIDALIEKHEDALMQAYHDFDDMLEPEVGMFFDREYGVKVEPCGEVRSSRSSDTAVGVLEWEEREIQIEPGLPPPGTLRH